MRRIDSSKKNLEVHLNNNSLSLDFIVDGLLGKGRNITYLEKCVASDNIVTCKDSDYRLPQRFAPIQWNDNNQWGTKPPSKFEDKIRFYDRIQKCWIEM